MMSYKKYLRENSFLYDVDFYEAIKEGLIFLIPIFIAFFYMIILLLINEYVFDLNNIYGFVLLSFVFVIFIFEYFWVKYLKYKDENPTKR